MGVKPTEYQRNARSADRYSRKAHGYTRATNAHKGAVAKDIATHKGAIRRGADTHRVTAQKDAHSARYAATKDVLNQKALATQETGRRRGQNTLTAIESRGRIRQAEYAQRQQGTGTYAPSAPSVSFAGGITRSIFMAIVLIFVYALVTHSASSAGAISNIGGIFGKLTSTQPLFNPVTKTG